MIIAIVFFFSSLLTLCKCVTETTDLITGTGCGRTSQVAGGVVQSHQPFSTLPPIANDFECFFQMRAVRFNQKVRFMFTHFSLSPNDCSMTNITFFDGPRDTDPQIALICPGTPDVLTREFVSTRFWLTLKLQVSSTSAAQRLANFSGFYVSYTDNRNPCVDSSLELMCNNGRCIFQELECDGLNSCGDNTDEPSSCTTSSIGNGSSAGPSIDLTPLYIILTVAFAMLAAYVIYILLAFQWFKTLMVSCLHRCFLFAIRRRRKWREKSEAKISNGKISPIEKIEKMDKISEKPNNSKPPPVDPAPEVVIPPVFTSQPNLKKSKPAVAEQKDTKQKALPKKLSEKKTAPKNAVKTKSNPRITNSNTRNAKKPPK